MINTVASTPTILSTENVPHTSTVNTKVAALPTMTSENVPQSTVNTKVAALPTMTSENVPQSTVNKKDPTKNVYLAPVIMSEDIEDYDLFVLEEDHTNFTSKRLDDHNYYQQENMPDQKRGRPEPLKEKDTISKNVINCQDNIVIKIIDINTSSPQTEITTFKVSVVLLGFVSYGTRVLPRIF